MNNSRFNEFLQIAKEECKKKSIKIRLVDGKEITSESFSLSGYFDENEGVLATVTKISRWKEVFIHEFCHFLQWRDKSPLYCDKDVSKSIVLIDNWLNNKRECSKSELSKAVHKIQKLELEAEKMTVELAKSFELGLNEKKYIKEANAYILFYSVLKKHRKWCSKKGPSSVREIINIMPDTFVSSFKISKEFEELVVKRCFYRN